MTINDFPSLSSYITTNNLVTKTISAQVKKLHIFADNNSMVANDDQSEAIMSFLNSIRKIFILLVHDEESEEDFCNGWTAFTTLARFSFDNGATSHAFDKLMTTLAFYFAKSIRFETLSPLAFYSTDYHYSTQKMIAERGMCNSQQVEAMRKMMTSRCELPMFKHISHGWIGM
jgi:hypothetical protein